MPKHKNFDKKWELIKTEDEGWMTIQHTESGRFLRFCGNKEIQYFTHILCFSQLSYVVRGIDNCSGGWYIW